MKAYRYDRKKHGGGLLVYVKECAAAQRLKITVLVYVKEGLPTRAVARGPEGITPPGKALSGNLASCR